MLLIIDFLLLGVMDQSITKVHTVKKKGPWRNGRLIIPIRTSGSNTMTSQPTKTLSATLQNEGKFKFSFFNYPIFC